MAHGVHLSPDQVRTAEARGLWLVQNPRSNEGNRVGYAGALTASRRVALGTDGYPADLPDELDHLLGIARVHEPGTPEEVLRRRLEASRTLARERFGADLDGDRVELDPAPPRPGEPRTRARRVVVGGRVVVENGALAAADHAEILAHAREAAARLWQRMSAIG
jgi:cytosine/adenosine deaminase-related metal-dependent hydrolase